MTLGVRRRPARPRGRPEVRRIVRGFHGAKDRIINQAIDAAKCVHNSVAQIQNGFFVPLVERFADNLATTLVFFSGDLLELG